MSSTPKKIIFEEEARLKLKEGIDQLANIVGVTLGPKGKNIGIESSWKAPTITNDGNSIVKDLELKDPYMNMGILMGKEVAKKVKETSGDGTTTAIILLRTLVHHGVKKIASGVSPIHLKRGMEKGVAIVLKNLHNLATPVDNRQALENIATVSASGNKEIGQMISYAIHRIGKSGIIAIEEGKEATTTIEMMEGIRFDQGYTSPYFCTNQEKMVVEMEEVSLLITDKKISSIQELLPLLKCFTSTGKELLIIADDIEGDALSTLVVNKLQEMLKVVAVKAPSFGDRKKAILEDIAILTGSTLVSEEKGMQLKDVGIEVLGAAEKIKISKEDTTIIGGIGQKEAIVTRLKQLDREIAIASSDYDKEKLEERRKNLQGHVTVIRIGAPSEIEMKQKKQMFEDSLNATQAAQEGGLVPGGGVALIRASQQLKTVHLDGEEQIGLTLVLHACQAPFKQIVDNCGKDSSLYLEKILNKDHNYGFNALTETVGNLIEEKVIDPTNVVKNCLKYATSVAGIILISEALIVNAVEDREKQQ